MGVVSEHTAAAENRKRTVGELHPVFDASWKRRMKCVERMGARQAQLEYSAAEITQVSGTVEAALGQGVRCLPLTTFYVFIFVFLEIYFKKRNLFFNYS